MNIFNHPDMRRRIILISVLTLTACCIASTPAAGKWLSDKAVSNTVSTFFTQVLQRQDEAVLHGREAFVNPQQRQFALPLNKPLKAKDIDRRATTVCRPFVHWREARHRSGHCPHRWSRRPPCLFIGDGKVPRRTRRATPCRCSFICTGRVRATESGR